MDGWYYDFIIPVIVTILTAVVIHVLLHCEYGNDNRTKDGTLKEVDSF